MTLEQLNTGREDESLEALLACCGSQRWAERMLGRRPFESPETLHEHAQATWDSLSVSDWLQAFSKHPKIGEQSGSQWSTQEQREASKGGSEVLEAIRDMNVQYARRFGYIFIICATGRSAAEVRASLEERLNNDSEIELQVAGAEQAKIMRLRLDKLLSE